MSGFQRKSVAIWMSAFMVFSALGMMSTAMADEGGAAGRLVTKAPQWKVGDYWYYSISQRSVTYGGQVDFGTGTPGTVAFTGKIDFYEHWEVLRADQSSQYYELNHYWEQWENGTYKFTYQGQTSPNANYRLWTKSVTTTPMKMRKTDLATGDYNVQEDETDNYDAPTNWPGFWDYTYSTTYVVTHGATPINWYKFPMDFSTPNWQITGTETQDITQQVNREDGATGTLDVTLITTYDSMAGTIQAQKEVVNTLTAGIFDDCYKLYIRGGSSWTETGTWTQTNPPQPTQNINENGQRYFETWRWYSNTAGYIVNWNSTQADRGYLLSSKQYTPIPPNFVPQVKTADGTPYYSSMEIGVKEKEPKAIVLTVLDDDIGDDINWTVVSVTPGSNPPGASLMDGPPTFTTTTTESDQFTHMHTNTLTITAKQPKSIMSDTYTIRINVSDGNDMGNVEFNIRVRVYNVNDKPYLAMPVPEIGMRENSTMVCTTWKMTDIFKDQDREAGILDDKLTYTALVTSGPAVYISIDNDTGTVTFTVPDYAWESVPPTTWDSNIKFTVTDSGSGNLINKTSNSTTAKLHVEHVNHDPALSANGMDLEENGLTWAEDVVDTRLDLNKAFTDPDTRYAEDALTFSFSGQKNIGVKNNAGRITLTPTRDWNGKETIKFKATDRFGRIKELRLDCTVNQVPDAPAFCETEMDITWESEESLTIKEAAGLTGPLNKIIFAVTIKDPDEIMGAVDPHSCQWWVNDSMGNVVYKTSKFSQGDDDYEFKCNWVGAFSSQLSPYEIKCVAKDTFGLTSTYVWNLTVVNVNRPPSIVISAPMDNKTFTRGQKIYFDAWNSSDPDDPQASNLTFIWNSSKQGTIKQDRGISGAEFIFKNLKTGTHLITLTVQDTDGGETIMTFTVKVKEPPAQPVIPGFELAALAASIIAAVAILGRRRK